MREIKFRFWNVDTQTMQTVIDIYFSRKTKGIESIVTKDKKANYHIDFESQHELMQYTGLKDKNGVEIYEGDIVKGAFKTGKTTICKVEFNKLCSAFVCDVIDDKILLSFLFNEFEEIEVIGNIFESGEILNDSKKPE